MKGIQLATLILLVRLYITQGEERRGGGGGSRIIILKYEGWVVELSVGFYEYLHNLGSQCSESNVGYYRLEI